MNKKELLKYLGLFLISPVLIAIVVLILAFILLLTPIAGVVYLGYEFINMLNDVHRRKINYKLKVKKYEFRDISFYK